MPTSFPETVNERLESLVDLSRAAWMPTRNGKPISAQALKRWALEGVAGIKLEAMRVGTVLCSSRKKFEAFCAALSQLDSADFKNGSKTKGKPQKAPRNK